MYITDDKTTNRAVQILYLIRHVININEYNIPKEMIYSQELKGLVNDGFIKLQLQNDGLYHVVRRSELPHTHGN